MARPLLVHQNVVLLVLPVGGIAQLVRRSLYLQHVCRIAVVVFRFAWLPVGVLCVFVVRKCCLFLCLASVVTCLPCLIVRRIRTGILSLCIVR